MKKKCSKYPFNKKALEVSVKESIIIKETQKPITEPALPIPKEQPKPVIKKETSLPIEIEKPKVVESKLAIVEVVKEPKKEIKPQIIEEPKKIKTNFPEIPKKTTNMGVIKKPYENDVLLKSHESIKEEVKVSDKSPEKPNETSEERRARLKQLRDQLLQMKKKKVESEVEQVKTKAPEKAQKEKEQFITMMKQMKSASPEKKEDDKQKLVLEKRMALLSKIKNVMQFEDEDKPKEACV